MTTYQGGLVDEARVRRWLANLQRPEQLADPHMSALLRAHGRTAARSPVETGRAGALLIRDAIEAVAPPEGAPAAARLPYRVLRTCFLDGAKNRHAAAELGLSERQLSRERSRAIGLLTAQLAPPGERRRGALPPPLPDPFLPRPAPSAAIARAVAASGRVYVTGPEGLGKTTLVAAYASSSDADVFWYRGARGRDDGLAALLFEVGEHLASHDPSLATYVRGALPDVDTGLAARVAIAALGDRRRLFVLDGWDDGLDRGVESFLDEAAARLPLAVVTITAHPPRGAACVEVPPFSRAETAALLDRARVDADARLVDALHSWTSGNPALIASAAAWLSAPAPAEASVGSPLQRRSLLLTNLHGLARAASRAAHAPRPPAATAGRSARSRRPSSTACR